MITCAAPSWTKLWTMRGNTIGIRPFCLAGTSISMYPRRLRLAQSASLSFRTHLRTSTCRRHLAHFWTMDEPSIGFLPGVAFARANPECTVRFQLPTTIRYPLMWLLSSAIVVRPFAAPPYYATCGPLDESGGRRSFQLSRAEVAAELSNSLQHWEFACSNSEISQ